MKISTRGRYALKMMVEFAINSDTPTKINQVSKSYGISEKYLEQIVSILSKAKLVKSIRGAQGGYLLIKPVEEYTVWDILNVSEDNLLIVDDSLMHNKSVLNDSDKKILAMWDDLNVLISDYFKGISISSLIAEESGNDYII